MSAPALTCRDIRLQIGGLHILDGVNVEVAQGEILALVGPNGSGKSTLLNVINGFIRPDAGTVSLTSSDISAAPAWQRARAGLARTFQIVRLVEAETAIQNVAAGLLPYGSRWRFAARRHASKITHALERVHVAEFASWPVSSLSFGSRRKVELARAIVGVPRVLLVDEPTAGVSQAHIRDIRRVLEEEAARGCSIVIVDHNLNFISSITQRVVVLDAGKPVFEGSPADAFSAPAVIEAYLGKGVA